MARSDAARTALLDTAERLFALNGVAPVSDRRVADEAGNTNHSAVRYYFGDRDGLLRALVERHTEAVERCRAEAAPDEDSVLGDIRALIMPSMIVFGALAQPSYRARFLSQTLYDPNMRELTREFLTASVIGGERMRSLMSRLTHLDPAVVRGRSVLIARIVLTSTAEVEGSAERDHSDPRWPHVGTFLADAIAGMLAAPISSLTQ